VIPAAAIDLSDAPHATRAAARRAAWDRMAPAELRHHLRKILTGERQIVIIAVPTFVPVPSSAGWPLLAIRKRDISRIREMSRAGSASNQCLD